MSRLMGILNGLVAPFGIANSSRVKEYEEKVKEWALDIVGEDEVEPDSFSRTNDPDEIRLHGEIRRIAYGKNALRAELRAKIKEGEVVMGDVDNKLDELLGQLAGFASMSWDEDGVFETEKLTKEVYTTKERIKQLVIEARIDEIEYVQRECAQLVAGHRTGDIDGDYVQQRLETLKEEKNG